jgi:hypothetical protein
MKEAMIDTATLPSPDAPPQKARALIAQTTGWAAIMSPETMAQAREFAEILAKSDMVPIAYKNKPGDLMIAGAMGSRLGLDIFASLSGIAVINGRPTIWGDAMLAICQNLQAFEDIQESFEGKPYQDDFTAVCTVKRKGRSAVVETFSVADAKRASKWDEREKVERRSQNGGTYMAPNDSPWYRYPKRMLQMRARAFALRGCFADALAGFHMREELDEEELSALKDASVDGSASSVPNPVPAKARKARGQTVNVAAIKDGDGLVHAKGEPLAPTGTPPGEHQPRDNPPTDGNHMPNPAHTQEQAPAAEEKPEAKPEAKQEAKPVTDEQLVEGAKRVIGAFGEEKAKAELKAICERHGVKRIQEIQPNVARLNVLMALDDLAGIQ